jgi:hypothetical protein
MGRVFGHLRVGQAEGTLEIASARNRTRIGNRRADKYSHQQGKQLHIFVDTANGCIDSKGMHAKYDCAAPT